MLVNNQQNSFTDTNMPTKSMIDASILPLANAPMTDIVIVEDGDENV